MVYTNTNLKTYQRLWQQSRVGRLRQIWSETKGWRISWAQSPAAPGGGKDPCDNRGAAVTTGTSESEHQQNKITIFLINLVRVSG